MTPQFDEAEMQTLRLDDQLALRYRRTGTGRLLVLLHTMINANNEMAKRHQAVGRT